MVFVPPVTLGCFFLNGRAKMGNNRDIHTIGTLMEEADDDLLHRMNDVGTVKSP